MFRRGRPLLLQLRDGFLELVFLEGFPVPVVLVFGERDAFGASEMVITVRQVLGTRRKVGV